MDASGAPRDRPVEQVSIRFHIGAAEPRPGYETGRDEFGQVLFYDPEPVLTEQDVADATGLMGASRSVLVLRFTLTGAARLERVTEQHVGSRFLVFIANKLRVSPTIARPVTEGEIAIDAGLSKKLVQRVLRGYEAPAAGEP
jgi:preprotein translocase subunit SecD